MTFKEFKQRVNSLQLHDEALVVIDIGSPWPIDVRKVNIKEHETADGVVVDRKLIIST